MTSDNQPQKKLGDKQRKILKGVAAAASLFALYFGFQSIAYEKTDNAQVEAHAVLLAPKIAGYVTKVNVIEGQKVKAGDVLVEIDERDYQNALAVVKGEAASIEAKRHDAEKNYKRISELFSHGAVSQAQFDQATALWRDQKARFDAVNAQVSQSELNLWNTKIRAPADGLIARKSVEAGQLAAVGVPLIGFVGSQERWIVANFKETQIAGIKIGAKVHVSVDAISGKSFEGTVESLSAATGATFTLLPPDNATGNFTKVVQRVPVRIKLENLSTADIDALRAGLSADVRVSKL